MTNTLTTAAIAGILAISMVTDASAWSRNGSVTGPRGTKTFSVNGNCSGGTCSRSARASGVYGNTVTRNGSVSCSGHSCSGSRTTTLPSGRTIQRNRNVSW